MFNPVISKLLKMQIEPFNSIYRVTLYYKSCCVHINTFPKNRTKSPTLLIAATRRAFSARRKRASRADVQKPVLLIAVAVYAF